MERHPDITGLMGGSKSNKPDKDEEEMMNDIGGDLGVAAKVSTPSSGHEDTFDRQLDDAEHVQTDAVEQRQHQE